MTTLIKNRKNVFIKQLLTSGTGNPAIFTQNLYLGFAPDEVILRSWTVGQPSAGGLTGSYTLWWDKVGDLCSFISQQANDPRIVYKLDYDVSGFQKFEIRDTTNAAVTTSVTALPLIFVLEFIEYHK